MADKVENAEEFFDRVCAVMGDMEKSAQDERAAAVVAEQKARDRAIIDDVLDRVKEITLEVKGFADQSVRLAALRRELTGEGRGEVVATPTVKEAGDIMAAMARHRAQARDQVMGSTPLPEGAPPDDRTWFSPQGLAEHDREVAKKVLRYAVEFWLDHPKIKNNSMTTHKWIKENTETYWNPIAEHFGLTPADLAPVPAKVEYTPSDIQTRSFDFAADGVMWRIVCGEWCWCAKPGEWVKVDAGTFYHKQDVEMIARALREAKMMPAPATTGGG